MLTYGKDPNKIKTNPLSSSMDVANAMIYEFKGVQQKITEIKSKFHLLFNNNKDDDKDDDAEADDNKNNDKNIKTENKIITSTNTKGNEIKNSKSSKLIELIEKNGKKKEQKLKKKKQRMVMEKRKKQKLKHRELKRKRNVWLEENLPITASPINTKVNDYGEQHEKDVDDDNITEPKKKQKETEMIDDDDDDINKKLPEEKSKDSFFIKQNGDFYMSTIPKSRILIATDKNLNQNTKQISHERPINNKHRHSNQLHNDTINNFESNSKNNFKTNHYNNNRIRKEMFNHPIKINKFNDRNAESVNNRKTTSTTSTTANSNDELTDLHPSWIAARQKKKQGIQNFVGTKIKFDDNDE